MSDVQGPARSSGVCAHRCCARACRLASASGRSQRAGAGSQFRAPGEARVRLFLLQGAGLGATPGLWESLLSPPPSGSSARFRELVWFDRRPMFSCVKADPFGTSLFTLKKKKGVGVFKKGDKNDYLVEWNQQGHSFSRTGTLWMAFRPSGWPAASFDK